MDKCLAWWGAARVGLKSVIDSLKLNGKTAGIYLMTLLNWCFVLIAESLDIGYYKPINKLFLYLWPNCNIPHKLLIIHCMVYT